MGIRDALLDNISGDLQRIEARRQQDPYMWAGLGYVAASVLRRAEEVLTPEGPQLEALLNKRDGLAQTGDQ